MLEEGVKALIKKCLRFLPRVCVLLDNERGLAWVKRKDGSFDRKLFGLGPNGTSDMVGWQEIIITPDMVGRKIAQIVVFEVKRDLKSKPTVEQLTFVSAVQAAGGCGAVIYGPVPEPAVRRALFLASKGVKVALS